MIDCPEYNVVVGILRQAVTDATSTPTPSQCRQKGRRGFAVARDDALRWMADETSRPFSFRWCCDIVGLDATEVRRSVADSPNQVRHQLSSVRRESVRFAGAGAARSRA